MTETTPADHVPGSEQGQWTYEHYAALDDGERYEIIAGTRTHDRRRKFAAYARCGIPEYWLVNPETHTIEIYVLEEGAYQLLGAFRGQEPLRSRIVPQMETVRAEQCFA